MNKKYLESLKEKLKEVTLERGFTDRYDIWTESRKALAHALLAFVAELERDLVEDPVQPEPPRNEASLEQRAKAPTINVCCEVRSDGITGSTFLDVEKTTREHDGSYTVVCHVEQLPTNAKFALGALRMKSSYHGYLAGTIVYPFKYSDYGCAHDDTRSTGVEHGSYTLNPAGDCPFFTLPRNSLEKL